MTQTEQSNIKNTGNKGLKLLAKSVKLPEELDKIKPDVIINAGDDDNSFCVENPNSTELQIATSSISGTAIGEAKNRVYTAYSTDGQKITVNDSSDWVINGTSKADTIYGGSGDDTLYAGEGDIVHGNAGNNVLIAQGDNATIEGNIGNDDFYVYGNNVNITSGEGTDYIRLETGNVTVNDLNQNDYLVFSGESGTLEANIVNGIVQLKYNDITINLSNMTKYNDLKNSGVYTNDCKSLYGIFGISEVNLSDEISNGSFFISDNDRNELPLASIQSDVTDKTLIGQVIIKPSIGQKKYEYKAKDTSLFQKINVNSNNWTITGTNNNDTISVDNSKVRKMTITNLAANDILEFKNKIEENFKFDENNLQNGNLIINLPSITNIDDLDNLQVKNGDTFTTLSELVDKKGLAKFDWNTAGLYYFEITENAATIVNEQQTEEYKTAGKNYVQANLEKSENDLPTLTIKDYESATLNISLPSDNSNVVLSKGDEIFTLKSSAVINNGSFSSGIVYSTGDITFTNHDVNYNGDGVEIAYNSSNISSIKALDTAGEMVTIISGADKTIYRNAGDNVVEFIHNNELKQAIVTEKADIVSVDYDYLSTYDSLNNNELNLSSTSEYYGVPEHSSVNNNFELIYSARLNDNTLTINSDVKAVDVENYSAQFTLNGVIDFVTIKGSDFEYSTSSDNLTIQGNIITGAAIVTLSSGKINIGGQDISGTLTINTDDDNNVTLSNFANDSDFKIGDTTYHYKDNVITKNIENGKQIYEIVNNIVTIEQLNSTVDWSAIVKCFDTDTLTLIYAGLETKLTDNADKIYALLTYDESAGYTLIKQADVEVSKIDFGSLDGTVNLKDFDTVEIVKGSDNFKITGDATIGSIMVDGKIINTVNGADVELLIGTVKVGENTFSGNLTINSDGNTIKFNDNFSVNGINYTVDDNVFKSDNKIKIYANDSITIDELQKGWLDIAIIDSDGVTVEKVSTAIVDSNGKIYAVVDDIGNLNRVADIPENLQITSNVKLTISTDEVDNFSDTQINANAVNISGVDYFYTEGKWSKIGFVWDSVEDTITIGVLNDVNNWTAIREITDTITLNADDVKVLFKVSGVEAASFGANKLIAANLSTIETVDVSGVDNLTIDKNFSGKTIKTKIGTFNANFTDDLTVDSNGAITIKSDIVITKGTIKIGSNIFSDAITINADGNTLSNFGATFKINEMTYNFKGSGFVTDNSIWCGAAVNDTVTVDDLNKSDNWLSDYAVVDDTLNIGTAKNYISKAAADTGIAEIIATLDNDTLTVIDSSKLSTITGVDNKSIKIGDFTYTLNNNTLTRSDNKYFNELVSDSIDIAALNDNSKWFENLPTEKTIIFAEPIVIIDEFNKVEQSVTKLIDLNKNLTINKQSDSYSITGTGSAVLNLPANQIVNIGGVQYSTVGDGISIKIINGSVSQISNFTTINESVSVGNTNYQIINGNGMDLNLENNTVSSVEGFSSDDSDELKIGNTTYAFNSNGKFIINDSDSVYGGSATELIAAIADKSNWKVPTPVNPPLSQPQSNPVTIPAETAPDSEDTVTGGETLEPVTIPAETTPDSEDTVTGGETLEPVTIPAETAPDSEDTVTGEDTLEPVTIPTETIPNSEDTVTGEETLEPVTIPTETIPNSEDKVTGEETLEPVTIPTETIPNSEDKVTGGETLEPVTIPAETAPDSEDTVTGEDTLEPVTIPTETIPNSEDTVTGEETLEPVTIPTETIPNSEDTVTGEDTLEPITTPTETTPDLEDTVAGEDTLEPVIIPIITKNFETVEAEISIDENGNAEIVPVNGNIKTTIPSNGDGTTTADYSKTSGVKEITTSAGKQIIIFNDSGGNTAIITDTTGDKKVIAGSGGDIIINQNTKSAVSIISGSGADTIIASGAANEYIELGGGADILIAHDGATINNYNVNTGAAIDIGISNIVEAIENNSITFANDELIYNGKSLVLNPNINSDNTFANIISDNNSKVTKLAWSHKGDGNLETNNAALLVGNYNNDKAGTTITGSAENDTVFVGDGDKINLTGGNDIVKINHDSAKVGVTIAADNNLAAKGQTAITGFNDGYSNNADRIEVEDKSLLKFKFVSGFLKMIYNGISMIFNKITGRERNNIESSSNVADILVTDNSSADIRYRILSNGGKTAINDDYSAPTEFVGESGVDGAAKLNNATLVDFTKYDETLNANMYDTLSGDKHFYNIESLKGGRNNTTLVGADNVHNALIAGAGATSIYGGKGRDSLFGYDNSDVAKRGATKFFMVSGGGLDTIEGFNFGADELNDELNTFGQDVTKVSLDGSGNLHVQVGDNVNDQAIINGAANEILKVNTFGRDWVVEFGDSLTYNSAVDVYGDADKFNNAIFVSADYSNDTVEIYANGFDGKAYLNVSEINASGYAGNATLVGGNADDRITASKGSSSLWGGEDGDDTLIGGGNFNEFFYLKGNGRDVIEGAKNGDIVNLMNINIEDITSLKVDDKAISLKFADGGSLKVNSVDVKFTLSDGTELNRIIKTK